MPTKHPTCEQRFVVAPVLRRYPLAPGVEVVPVRDVEHIVGQAWAKNSPAWGGRKSVGVQMLT